MSCHFLDRLTFMGVSNGLGFCVTRSLLRCGAALRRYWNPFVKMQLMEGIWNHRIVRILGSILARYVVIFIWWEYQRVWVKVCKYLGVGTKINERVCFIIPILLWYNKDGKGLGDCMCYHFG